MFSYNWFSYPQNDLYLIIEGSTNEPSSNKNDKQEEINISGFKDLTSLVNSQSKLLLILGIIIVTVLLFK